jgi:predicted O-methyltransferase YrrM
LILGNSKDTLPQFVEKNPEPFDLIFLDASHDLDTVRSDMEYCRKVATKETWIVMDDVYWPDSGTTKVWKEYVEQGKIIETDRKTYQVGRAMTWGKFNII